MAEKTLADEIITIINSEANNNLAPLTGSVTNIYTDGYIDVITPDGVMKYIQCIGEAKKDKTGVLVFINGDDSNPVFIVDTDTTEQIILALGLGKFTISDDGDLYVELPNGVENPFSINNTGDLIVEIPAGASNDYAIDENGDLIYDRWDI